MKLQALSDVFMYKQANKQTKNLLCKKPFSALATTVNRGIAFRWKNIEWRKPVL